jgi:hypothetical protein
MARFLLLVLISIGLALRALACDELSANAKAQEHTPDNRTFVLDLQLDKSGRVLSVQVLMGTGPLRSHAIQAAAHRKYPPRTTQQIASTAVEVRFSGGKDRSPEVREIALGVPSCVPGGIPMQWPLIPWVNKLLSNQPILPFPLPSGASNQ